MPNTHENLTSLFKDIANAIRAKTGAADYAKITADSFPSAIAAIPTSGGEEISDFVGFSPLSVNGEIGGPMVGVAQWSTNSSAKYYVVCCFIFKNGSTYPEAIGSAFSLVDSNFNRIKAIGDPNTMIVRKSLSRISISIPVDISGQTEGTPITAAFYGGYLI